MNKNFPKFWIYAVIDGENKGLFVEKQKSETAQKEKVYFYFENGLRPTTEIKKASKYNTQLLYTKDDREESIFNEIIAYAINVSQHGKKGIFEFANKHNERRGYQEVVDRYYEDDRYSSPFKKFFKDAETLKKKVLKNYFGKHHLAEGMAEEFKVLSPHQMTVEDFKYLEPIRDILKIGENSPKKRLMKAGPIADDFEHQRIYTRSKLLEDLKNLVLQNSVSMLVGESATGKTVLARQLGYKLCAKDKWAVYYFDCDLERDFDWRKLLREINSVRGIFILENIHLATQQFQRICHRIEENPNRYVLLTARPSFRNSQSQRDVDLSELSSVELIPFDGVDEIIDHFASYHEEVTWPATVRESIKKVSKESFWLLSYALEGYIHERGMNAPLSWLKGEVRKDLSDLGLKNSIFPQVLFAVAPLYCNEVLTSKFYLTSNLNFSQNVLDELARLGEITEQEIEGKIFYGLPHSALARAYWIYGEKYRCHKQPEKGKDFLLDYAESNTSNGLQAISHTEPEFRKELLNILDEKEELENVIEREIFLLYVGYWGGLLRDNFFSKRGKRGERFLEMLSNKLKYHHDFNNVTLCFHTITAQDPKAEEYLWHSMKDWLAEKMSKIDDFKDAITALRDFSYSSAREELFDLIDFSSLKISIENAKNIEGITGFIELFPRFSSDVEADLFRLLDPRILASKLKKEDKNKAEDFIRQVKALSPQIGKEIEKYCQIPV